PVVNLLKDGLVLQFTFSVGRLRHLCRIVVAQILLSGKEGMMRLEDVYRHQPGGELALIAHKLLCNVCTPCRLGILRIDRHSPRLCSRWKLWQFDPLAVEPHIPLVMQRPIVGDVVAPFNDLVAIVNAVFNPATSTWGQVQLANQPAGVLVVRKNFGNQLLGWAYALPVSAQPGHMPIAPGEKTCPRWRTNGRLYKGVCKGD